MSFCLHNHRCSFTFMRYSRIILNDGWREMLEETVVAYLKILLVNSPGKAMENHESPRFRRIWF
jgi:hypothetical protein